MLLGLMLTVTAIFSCNTHPAAEKPKKEFEVIKTDSLETLNLNMGKKYYVEREASIYWVKKRGAKAALAHFPNVRDSTTYNAYAFMGVMNNDYVYTWSARDNVGEICFKLSDLTTNPTETWFWQKNIKDSFSTLLSAVAKGCSMNEEDLAFRSRVWPTIFAEMRSMKLPILKTMNHEQISSILKSYTENKKSQYILEDEI